LEFLMSRSFGKMLHSGATGTDPVPSMRGVFVAAGPNQLTLAPGGHFADDYFNGWSVSVDTGALAGSEYTITDFVGATGVAVVSPNWSSVPAATDFYSVTNDLNSYACGRGMAVITTMVTSGTKTFTLWGLTSSGWGIILDYGDNPSAAHPASTGERAATVAGRLYRDVVNVAPYDSLFLQMSGGTGTAWSWIDAV
tara:strand:+ start:1095 stop:1682 length:588 start_codon:yes stop_codon:yes gene_type:complete